MHPANALLPPLARPQNSLPHTSSPTVPSINAMLTRSLLLACLLAVAHAQAAQHRVWYNSADECKNELCWQCVCPLRISIPLSPGSLRYLIPFWLVAVMLIVIGVCCKLMYTM